MVADLRGYAYQYFTSIIGINTSNSDYKFTIVEFYTNFWNMGQYFLVYQVITVLIITRIIVHDV